MADEKELNEEEQEMTAPTLDDVSRSECMVLTVLTRRAQYIALLPMEGADSEKASLSVPLQRDRVRRNSNLDNIEMTMSMKRNKLVKQPDAQEHDETSW